MEEGAAIRVELGNRSYDVRVGSGLVDVIAEGMEGEKELAVITDETVRGLPWFHVLWERMREGRGKRKLLVVSSGETSKSWVEAGRLLRELAAEALSRRLLVVAVGGGVVGDLAGFVAAVYLRGVRLHQVPTTLLAAVDSSVGGKTGVNLPEGKNLVGAFLQPSAVWIDTDFLETLPEKEWSAGMAEVIKYGMIADADFFEQLESGPLPDRAALIRRCVAIKAAVVREDERETTGRRAVLNFGHTLGHAIEQAGGYGTLSHGQAVALGMVGATWLSEEVAGLERGTVERMRRVLRRHGLPDRMTGLEWEGLAPALVRDKKATADGVRWVLATRVGSCSDGWTVPEELARRAVRVVCGENEAF